VNPIIAKAAEGFVARLRADRLSGVIAFTHRPGFGQRVLRRRVSHLHFAGGRESVGSRRFALAVAG